MSLGNLLLMKEELESIASELRVEGLTERMKRSFDNFRSCQWQVYTSSPIHLFYEALDYAVEQGQIYLQEQLIFRHESENNYQNE